MMQKVRTILMTDENSMGKADGTSCRYLRREHFVGTACRAFYVGNNVTQDDMHARSQDGTLHLFIDTKQPTTIENKQLIAIEG
ncbi:MAG: hypothetical protein LUD79_01665 [Oscillospiraceae bacterium]|nr:hypothetical protein [Oscillospiraceae bacterium]